MFSATQMIELAVLLLAALVVIVPAAAMAGKKGFEALGRRFDAVEGKQIEAETRGIEIQANTRKIANGRSVHHAAPAHHHRRYNDPQPETEEKNTT